MLNMNKEAIYCGWAKRFFNVDESQGTIGYAKAEKKKQSVVLPLADITAVSLAAARALACNLDSFSHCLVHRL
eukprot:964617-Pleurochrysis_carterae.AAC.1